MKKSTVFKKIGLIAVTLMLAMVMIIVAVSPVAAADEYTDVTYYSVSVSVDGSIQLKFYINDLGSLADAEDGYLAVRVPDINGDYYTQKVLVEDLAIDARGKYVLSIRLAAAQQTEKIYIQPVIGDWTGAIFGYSVSDYNQTVLELANDDKNANHEAYKKVAAPLKAMLNYGAMAQAEFDYRMDDKANEGVYENGTNQNPADAVGTNHFQDVPGATRVEVGNVMVPVVVAQYKSEVNAYVYIKSPSEKPVVTVKLGDAKAYTVADKEVLPAQSQDGQPGWYCIVIENVPTHRFDRTMVIKAYVNDNNYGELTCSLLNYLENAITKENSGVTALQKRTAQALYNFYVAMKGYNEPAVQPEPVKCSHVDTNGNFINVYNEILTAATCQKEGKMVKVCALCNEQIENSEVTIDKASHKYYVSVTKFPTCTEEGTQVQKCKSCGELGTIGTIATLPHSYVDVISVEATCTTTGLKTTECMFCGTATAQEVIEPLEHDVDYSKGVITEAPGCETTGVRAYPCKNCDYKETRTVAPLGHTLGDVERVEPTCTTDGSITAKCTECDYEVAGEVIPATGHKYGKATCTAPATCSVCSATTGEVLAHQTTKATCDAPETCYVCKTVVSAALGHNYVNHEGQEPTCTAPGYSAYTECTNGCGYTTYEEIAALGHTTLVEKIPAQTPTCTADGKTAVMGCERCDYTEGGASIDALGHTELVEKVPAQAPTCAVDGVAAVMGCQRCDYTEGGEVLPATGAHVYATETERVEATCTADGYVVMACGCGATEQTVLEALGHTELVEKVPATPATCIATGLTAVMGCERCDDINVGGEPVDMLDHAWDDGVAEGANIKFTCTTCGETRVEQGNVNVVIEEIGEVIAGETFTLTIGLENNPGIWAFRFELPINTEMFEFVSAESPMLPVFECGVEDGKIVFEAMNNTAENAHGETVVVITLKTKATADSGEYTFTVEPTADNMVNFEEQVIAVNAGSVTVAIKGHTPVAVEGKAPTCAENGLTDGLVCSECGAVIKAQEVIVAPGHALVTDIEAVDATCTTAGNTAGKHCTNCDYIEASEVVASLGHDRNEFSAVSECSRCGVEADRFVNVIFEKGDLANVHTNGAYTVAVTEDGVKFMAAANTDSNITFFEQKGDVETGKYLFFKYRAEGEITIFQVFTSTDSAKPSGSYNFKPTFTADGEWHIAVIEVPCVSANEEDGKYYAKHLRFDVEGEGIYAEFAYVGYAADVADIAAFVGDEIADHCAHNVGTTNTYVDVNTHNSVCGLCGAILGNVAHTTDKTATWNAETNRYEAECTACGGVAVKSFQTTHLMDGSWGYAHGGSGTSSKYVDGVLVMTPNGNTAWGGLSWTNAGTVGRYYVLKYRVTELKEAADIAKMHLRVNGSAKEVRLNADGEWHVIVLDLTNYGLTDDGNGFVTTVDYWFCNYADANLVSYEVAMAGFVESLDKLPADLCDGYVCDHNFTTELSVYEVIGDGSGTMYYATCDICGEKVTKVIPINRYWWNSAVANGSTVSNGQYLWGGWASVAGGFQDALFTITNAEDPTETTVVVVPVTKVGYAHEYWPEKLGAADDRYWINIQLAVDDWANVNGVDFNGDTVTVSCAVVLRKDPTAAPLALKLDNSSAYSVTLNVEYHEHTAAETVEGDRTEPTCTADGSVVITTKCACGAQISQETVVIPATGHTAVGTSGEYCSTCKTFIKADPTTLFNKFIGGTNMPNASNAGVTLDAWSANGYRFYDNTDGTERFVKPSFDGSVTGQYMVMKFKATGDMNFDFFTATSGSGATGSGDTFKYIPAVYDEWQYFIIDLSSRLSSKVVADENGNYSIKYLRLDVQGVGTAEIAYIAYADSMEKLVNGIKTLEGVEYVNESYCTGTSILSVGACIDEYTHAPVCSLCGKQGAVENHYGATSGAWNGNYYVSNVACSVCNEKYDFGATVYLEAEKLTIGQGAWNTSQSNGTDGNIGYAAITSKNGVGTWADAYAHLNPTGAVTGQYLVVRYKVPAAVTYPNLTITTDANGGNSKSVITPLTVDGEWHIVIIDLASAGFNSNSVFSNSSRFNFNNWGANETIYIDWFRFYDDANRIPDEYKPACDHTNLNENVDQGDGTHADVCRDCLRVLNVEAHTGAGLNGEICSACKTFLFDTTGFNKFVPGTATFSYSGGLGDNWSANGYRLYTKSTDGGELYMYPSFDGSVTGQYMILKYKATGTINFQFYQSTVQAGAHGDYCFRHYPAVYGEWQYYIVDMTTVLPASGIVAVDGTYSIKGLRWDVEGQGDFEFAYLAYADSLEKAINGIKAVDGVDALTSSACPHLSEYVVCESINGAQHATSCGLCGSALTTEAHTHEALATWNASTGKYESTCSVCGGTAQRDWQWVRDYSEFADGKTFSCTGGGSSHRVENGALVMNVNGNTTWGGVSVGASEGQLGMYYVLKYKVDEVLNGATTAKIILRFNGQVGTVTLVADGEWHVSIINISAFAGTPTDGLIAATGDHWFLNYADSNLVKYEVALEACVDSLDRLPTEFFTEGAICDHNYNTPMSSYEVVGDGTAREYFAICDVCGGKATQGISKHTNWDHAFGVGSTLKNNQTVLSGWALVTGGVKNFVYVITDGENTVEIATPDITSYRNDIANVSSGKYAYMGADRGYAKGDALVITDWSDVQGVDFEGKTVTITAYAVSRADNSVRVQILSDRTAVVDKHIAVEGGTPVQENVVEATCTTNGSYDLVTYCACGAEDCKVVVNKETVTVPATGKHIGATYGTWNSELGYYESDAACTLCGAKYNFGSAIYVEGEKINIGQPAWGTSQSNGTEGDIEYTAVKTGNAAGTWAAAYFPINSAGVVSGQYLVFKYKVPTAVTTNVLTFDHLDGNSSTAASIALTADGEWHVAIINLASAGFNANSKISNSARFNFTSWAADDTVYFDWFRVYDDAACIPAEYWPACEHTYADVVATQPDCINNGCTAGVVCTICGYTTSKIVRSTGECFGGSDGEYCKGCRTFTNADPTDYFTYFWGGESAPNTINASYKGRDSVTGYNVYTTTKIDYRHQLISTSEPTIAGRYLVVKYLLVEGEMTLGTFPTTRQSGINGSYTYNHRLEAGGWKYLIIDLKEKTVNGGVQADDNGDVYLKHFSVDYDLAEGTTATAEFAYMALARTFEDAIAGINAIEGTETVPQEYCLHTAGTNDLSVYEVIGDGSGTMYTGTCKACGAKAGIKTITPYKNHWDTGIENGGTYENGQAVVSGWVSVAGGWQDAIFTITNANDPTETTTLVVPVDTKSYDADPWPSILGSTAERRKIGIILVVDDWANVNGVNFSGDTVTVQMALVLNKDPEAAPISFKLDNAGTMTATITIAANSPVDTLWDKKAFATQMGWDSAELTADGAKFVGTVKGSAADLGAGNVISIIDGDKVYENSNYFFIKYKASAGTTIDVYLNALDDGTGGWNLISNASGLFIADDEWHVLVYDCLGSQADIFKIYFNTTSADSADPVIEIAYAGFAATEGQIMELLDAEKDTELVMSQIWDQDELMSVNLNNFDTRVETEDGVKFTGTNGEAWSHNQIVFMEDGKVENGNPAYLEGVNCFVIKYRVAEGTVCDMALDYPYPNGNWTQMGELIIADGEWHVLAFHLSSPNPYTCKVYFNAVEGTPEIEIAYAGFALIPSAD